MSEGTLILNAAKDIKNSVNEKDVEEITRTTLSQVLDTLLEISGPYAKNTFILGNAFQQHKLSNAKSVGNIEVKAFTKDGRNILAQLDYASPIQKYIKDDIVTHIGRCIDDKCGDGTTTSMIFATSFVANLMKYKEYFSRISSNALEEIYKKITDNILEKLEQFVIKVDENIEPHLIAFLQAYTSSGGMKEVAYAVSSVIKSTPKELWQYAITQNYPKGESESDTLVKTVTEDCQYGCPVTLYNPEYIFQNLNGVYENSNVDVLIMPYGLIINDPLFNLLKNFIKDELDKPLVVIIPNHLSKNIEELLVTAQQNNKDVLVFGYLRPLQNKSNHTWSLNALNIKANKKIPAPEIMDDSKLEDFIIKDVSIYTNGKYLKINNILPKEDNDNLHPVFKDQEKYYNTNMYLPILYQLLQQELALPNKDMYIVNDLKKALSIITSIHNTIIEVNGTALDQQLISLILDDATKAAQHSLLSGMVFDGPYRLYQAIFSSGVDYLSNNEITGVFNLCTLLLYKCLLQASVDMVQSVYGCYSKNMDTTLVSNLDKYNLSNKVHYYTAKPAFNGGVNLFNIGDTIQTKNLFNYESIKTEYTLSDTITVENEENIFDLLKEKGIDEVLNIKPLPPCQPANLYKELFNRVRESGLRFALIGELIVPGTVYDPNINKENK